MSFKTLVLYHHELNEKLGETVPVGALKSVFERVSEVLSGERCVLNTNLQ